MMVSGKGNHICLGCIWFRIARLARDIRWAYLLHEKSIRQLFAKGELQHGVTKQCGHLTGARGHGKVTHLG